MLRPTYVNRNGNEVPKPLYSGPIAAGAGGGATARRPDIATTSFAGLAASAQSALAASDLATFQTDINGPHGWVHGLVGGQMGSVAYAGFDPIFFLHHCNVDRLWWNWQRANPGASLPANEAVHQLAPFNRPFSTDWYVGADVESTDDLGYRYLNWCLFIPPILIWEVLVVKLPPVMRHSLRSARLVPHSPHMPRDSVEFRVFANQPRASHRSKIEGNPSFVGSIGTFGMGPVKMESRSTSTTFDLGINLTEHVMAALADEADELKLKIVAVNPDGEPIDAERLDVDEIELIFE